MALTVITKSYREVGKDAYEFAPTGVIKTNSNYIPGGGIAGGSGSISGATGGTGSIAIWTPGGIKGDPLFTFDMSTDILKIGDQGYGVFIKDDASSTIQRYGDLTIKSAVGKVYIENLALTGTTVIEGDTYFVTEVSFGGPTYFNNTTIFETSTYFITEVSFGGPTYFNNTSVFNNTTEFNSTNVFNNTTTFEGDTIYNSTNVTYVNNVTYEGDVSIGGTIYATDVSYINITVTNYDTSVTNWYVTNDASVVNDLYVGGDIFLNGTALGFNLADLGDVSINDPSLNSTDVLSYNGTKWVNKDTIDVTNIFQLSALYKSPNYNSAGSQGNMAFDASNFYICVSTNKWIKINGLTIW